MYISSYINDCRNLNRRITENLADKDKLFFTKQFSKANGIVISVISRSIQATLAIFASFNACVSHLARALDELIVSIVKLDPFGQSAKNCGIHLIAAVAQPLAIMILALATAVHADDIQISFGNYVRSKEEGMFDNRLSDTDSDDNINFCVTIEPVTAHFSPIEGAIVAPFRGVLVGVNAIAQSLFLGAHWCLSIPANDIEITERVETRLEDSSFSIIGGPLVGLVGNFLHAKAREEINIRVPGFIPRELAVET